MISSVKLTDEYESARSVEKPSQIDKLASLISLSKQSMSGGNSDTTRGFPRSGAGSRITTSEPDINAAKKVRQERFRKDLQMKMAIKMLEQAKKQGLA